jgi:hypothetical protein
MGAGSGTASESAVGIANRSARGMSIKSAAFVGASDGVQLCRSMLGAVTFVATHDPLVVAVSCSVCARTGVAEKSPTRSKDETRRIEPS